MLNTMNNMRNPADTFKSMRQATFNNTKNTHTNMSTMKSMQPKFVSMSELKGFSSQSTVSMTNTQIEQQMKGMKLKFDITRTL